MTDPENPGLLAFAEGFPLPPMQKPAMRQRSGIKRSCFFPVYGGRATSIKLHNNYLKPNIFAGPTKEYWAIRRAAGLLDVTGEEVIEISGPDALTLMNELVPRDLTRLADGRCLYCIMCYDYGGIVEDAILARFSADRLWWIGGPGFSEQWIYAHALGRQVTVKSYLDEIHVASLQGPKARMILQRVSDIDLGRLPPFGLASGRICGAPAVVSRTGYTAELGYDLYVAVEEGAALFAGLDDVGRPEGLALCGSAALDLRRVEAFIRNFGHDFDWQHSPFEVGLGWMVNFKKPRFTGREALARETESARTLVGLELAASAPLKAGSLLSVEARKVGEITSAIVSPTLERKIAIAMVAREAAAIGQVLTLAGDGEESQARVVPVPFLDPERRLMNS